MKLLLLLLTVYCCLNSLNSQTVYGYPKSDDIKYVFAKNGLNGRSQGDIKAAVVTSYSYGDSIKIMRSNERYQYDEINGREGYWVPVLHDDQEVYIFSGYLTDHIPPYFKDSLRLISYKRSLEEWILNSIVEGSKIVDTGFFKYEPMKFSEKGSTTTKFIFTNSGSSIYINQGWEWSQFKVTTTLVTINDIVNFKEYYEEIFGGYLSRVNIENSTMTNFYLDDNFEEFQSIDSGVYCGLNYNQLVLIINFDQE